MKKILLILLVGTSLQLMGCQQQPKNVALVSPSLEPGNSTISDSEAEKRGSQENRQERISDLEAKVTKNPQRDAYFGELHLHASYSLDAFGIGKPLSPDEAYRFAQGKEVPTQNGGKTKITAPLDFAAVTEHSEWLGETSMIQDKNHPKFGHKFAKMARERDEDFFKTILAAEVSGNRPPDFSGEDGKIAFAQLGKVWHEIIVTTERHYKPGKFTTLHAFEWTAAPDGNNLHRNIIFRGNAKDIPVQPTSWFESRTVEELWKWMAEVGGGPDKVFAIPHNANMSGGLMFKPEYSDGRAIDADYAKLRSVSEPLMEIMQAKGASETHPQFAPNDEFANFELMPITNFEGPVENSPYSWMREGLKQGLQHEKNLGVNPFKYGIVAATDQHNGMMGDTDEFDFTGSHGVGDSTPRRRLLNSQEVFDFVTLNPGGLTGVWAEANTRGHIWDALRRKETFGTSGVRIRVRLFGGYHFTKEMASDEDFVKLGYEKGVSMGGDLANPDDKVSPTFLVWATKDPLSGNLDRIQIIKGWLDDKGELHESIANVTWSGKRQLDEKGKLPPIGNTVDLDSATYKNSIGAKELYGYWKDENFDRSQRAFYYARVLEIPTPRWSTYDAAKAKMALSRKVPSSIQERAWTSPIWYSPSR